MQGRLSCRQERRSIRFPTVSVDGPRAIQETIGISGAQGNILNYILVESQNRSVYQKDIEQEFGLRPSTATETLKSLEKNGLIKRETDQMMEDIRKSYLLKKQSR